jgi:hypothetical protein
MRRTTVAAGRYLRLVIPRTRCVACACSLFVFVAELRKAGADCCTDCGHVTLEVQPLL